jgi:hypothetical protein
MSDEYRSKVVCCCDLGLFTEFAVALTKSFGTVLYYMPALTTFPKSNDLLVGDGLPGVHRIDSIWEVLDEVDLWVFPDCNMGSLQVHLEKLGKRVWGGRMGDELELYRADAKVHMQKLGLDIGPWRTIKGIDALRAYLMRHEDKYVKVSRTRGDFESFHSPDYDLIEPFLDELAHSLGAKKKVMEFIVEDAINDAVECGIDSFCIDGKFPETNLWGIEIKDAGYVGRVDRYEDLPPQLTKMTDKLGPTFEAYGYRGFFSSEMRITEDGKGWVLDPTCRCPSPPGGVYTLLIENLADIFWHGAEGVLVEPQMAAEWAVELCLLSSWAEKCWQAIKIPPSLKDHVKLHNQCVIDGETYIIPQAVGSSSIGSVVSLGNSMQEAIDSAKEIAEQVKGYSISYDGAALDKASDEFAKLETLDVVQSEAA